MAWELFEFWWDVFEGSYRLVTLEHPETGAEETYLSIGRTYLPPRASDSPVATSGIEFPEQPRGIRRYPPMRTEPALFRTFAETEPEPEAILAFAQQYGHLGVEQFKLDEWDDMPGVRRWYDPAEPMELWQAEIRAMRDALAVWEMVERSDRRGLKSLATQSEHRRELLSFDSHAETDGAKEILWVRPDPRVVDPKNPDLLQLAQFYVTEAANRRLARTSVRVLLAGLPQLHIVPANLREALWLQFALSLSGRRDFRKCDREKCGRWFELAPQARRRIAVYCSVACRNKAYRERQEEARKLHAAGRTIKVIAKQLRSDVETVKGWVEGKKSTDR